MIKRIPVILLSFLTLLQVTPCSAQKAPGPLHPAFAQSERKSEMPHFSHAEMIQFIHTLQTEVAGWRDTINSIEPSALNIPGKVATVIEQQKGSLLFNLNGLAKLHPRTAEKNKALDLAVEFQAFNELAEIKDGLTQLSFTLADYPKGQIGAAQSMQIYKEAIKAKTTLYGEILARIVNLAFSEREKARQ